MKALNERIVEVSRHLQSLVNPEFSDKVQEAVAKNDKDSLLKICRKAKIPRTYSSTIISVLLSVGPDQKWPPGI
jgi:hypothetical protein